MWMQSGFHKRFTSAFSGELLVPHYFKLVVHMSYAHYYYY